jgi:hypothetical protein
VPLSDGKLSLSEEECQKIFDCKRLIDRVISTIHQFRHEHKIFKGSFIFKSSDYQETCQKEYTDLEAFIIKNDVEEFRRGDHIEDFKSVSSHRKIVRQSDAGQTEKHLQNTNKIGLETQSASPENGIGNSSEFQAMINRV